MIAKGTFFIHDGVAWKAVESSLNVGGSVGEVVFAKRVCWFEEELRHFGPERAISVAETMRVVGDFLKSAARRMDDGGIYGLLDDYAARRSELLLP